MWTKGTNDAEINISARYSMVVITGGCMLLVMFNFSAQDQTMPLSGIYHELLA